MITDKDDIRQQLISELLAELDNFERTAARTMDRNELDEIEKRLKEIIEQLREVSGREKEN